MSAKSNAADIAKRIAARAGQEREVGKTALSTAPIRTTVDLEPGLWSGVQSWIATEQGRTRKKIKFSAVCRALLTLLVEDPGVADKLRAQLDGRSNPASQ